MYNQSWLFFARWKYPYTHTRGTQHTLINVHAHFWLNGIFICCHEKWCVWMRRNKLWSILVKWNLYPGSLISGTTAIVFVFLLVLAMLLRLLFVFFRSFKRFVCGVRFLLHLRQQSVAICCFRFTDFIDSFFYRLSPFLPLSPSISGITHKRAHICQFTSVRATAKWWIVHFIIIWCAQEFIYAKPEMSENAW